MRKPLLIAICLFVCLNHHERRKLTPDYDEGSLEANGLHSDPKIKGTKAPIFTEACPTPYCICIFMLKPNKDVQHICLWFSSFIFGLLYLFNMLT
jgi:hypothetical protein